MPAASDWAPTRANTAAGVGTQKQPLGLTLPFPSSPLAL